MTQLDDEQAQAVELPPGPLLVLAGAGAGKTTMLVSRIAHQCATGAWEPSAVLAVTHSTKAAGHMHARLQQLGVRGVVSRTFHAHALSLVREFWAVTGRSGAGPVIAENTFGIVRDAIRKSARGVDADSALVSDVLNEIGWAKSQLLTADTYPRKRTVSSLPAGAMAKILRSYQDTLEKSGQLDFADLLLEACRVLEHEPVRQTVTARTRHLLVDEYQDTDPAQQKFLDCLLAGRDDVTAVGDPRQAIFSFKGADPSLIAGFADRYPGCRVVDLVRNYRSTPQVVDVANAMNPLAGLPPLQAQSANGDRPMIRLFADEESEAAGVARLCANAISNGTPASEIAILLRFNSQSVPFEQALSNLGVPYTVLGNDRYFDRPEIVAVLRHAWQLSTADPDLSAQDVIDQALSSAGFNPASPPAGAGAARDRWEAYATLSQMAGDGPDGDSDAKAFLRELAHRRQEAHSATTSAVSISTIHRAKGLEWAHVIVPRMVEGSLPSSYAQTPDEVAEEHRLAYVAVTRARRTLTLSWARRRSAGKRSWPATKSRYLDLLAGTVREERPLGDADARPRQARVAATRARCSSCETSLDELHAPLASCPQHLGSRERGLLADLVEWRARTAKGQSLPVFAVVPDKALAALVLDPPAAVHRLAMAGGMGSVRAKKYGPALMEIIERHR